MKRLLALIIWGSLYATPDPLYTAVWLNSDIQFDFYLQQEPKPNEVVDKNGNNLLHWAAIRGNFYMLKALYEKGLNPLVQNKKGKTPLYEAIIAASKANNIKQYQPIIDFLKEDMLGNGVAITADDLAIHESDTQSVQYTNPVFRRLKRDILCPGMLSPQIKRLGQ